MLVLSLKSAGSAVALRSSCAYRLQQGRRQPIPPYTAQRPVNDPLLVWFSNLGAKRVCVSRKSVPKRKAGIPLDELLAAHAAGDDRLETLMGRYRGSVVPASTLGAKPAQRPKPTRKGSKKASGARLARLDDSPRSSDRRTASNRLRARLHGRADNRAAARRATRGRVRRDPRRFGLRGVTIAPRAKQRDRRSPCSATR